MPRVLVAAVVMANAVMLMVAAMLLTEGHALGHRHGRHNL